MAFHIAAAAPITTPLLTNGTIVLLKDATYLQWEHKYYANTTATIMQVPTHPDTWYLVKLFDGKEVKLRSSSFWFTALMIPPHILYTQSPSLSLVLQESLSSPPSSSSASSSSFSSSLQNSSTATAQPPPSLSLLLQESSSSSKNNSSSKVEEEYQSTTSKDFISSGFGDEKDVNTSKKRWREYSSETKKSKVARVISGKSHVGKVGKIIKGGHGFYTLKIPGVTYEVSKRRIQLEFLFGSDENEDEEEENFNSTTLLSFQTESEKETIQILSNMESYITDDETRRVKPRVHL